MQKIIIGINSSLIIGNKEWEIGEEMIKINKEKIRWILIILGVYWGYRKIKGYTEEERYIQGSMLVLGTITVTENWGMILIVIEIYSVIGYIIMIKDSPGRGNSPCLKGEDNKNIVISYIVSSIVGTILLIGHIIKNNNDLSEVIRGEGGKMISIYIIYKIGLFPYSYYINTVYSNVKEEISYYILIFNKIIYVYLASKVIDNTKEIMWYLGVSMIIGGIQGIGYISIRNIMINSSLMNVGVIMTVEGDRKVYIWWYIIMVLIIYKINKEKGKELNIWVKDSKNNVIISYIVITIIGIPPTINFWIKYNIIEEIRNMSIIVIMILVSSIISSIYYMYILQYSYFNIIKLNQPLKGEKNWVRNWEYVVLAYILVWPNVGDSSVILM